MIIPDPKANFGDIVQVRNYRRNPPVWEPGTVSGLSYASPYGEFSWRYDVTLTRKTLNDNHIRLHVADSGIWSKP